jgi:hypothetical protein
MCIIWAHMYLWLLLLFSRRWTSSVYRRYVRCHCRAGIYRYFSQKKKKVSLLLKALTATRESVNKTSTKLLYRGEFIIIITILQRRRFRRLRRRYVSTRDANIIITATYCYCYSRTGKSPSRRRENYIIIIIIIIVKTNCCAAAVAA